MTEPSHGYTDEERAADLAHLRSLTRKLHRQQRAVEETSTERLAVLQRLRRAGATYPELAAAMGVTYSAVQRLLARIESTATDSADNDNDTEGDTDS